MLIVEFSKLKHMFSEQKTGSRSLEREGSDGLPLSVVFLPGIHHAAQVCLHQLFEPVENAEGCTRRRRAGHLPAEGEESLLPLGFQPVLQLRESFFLCLEWVWQPLLPHNLNEVACRGGHRGRRPSARKRTYVVVPAGHRPKGMVGSLVS